MKDRTALLICLTVFVLLALHGSLIGLTDDEAYYWVLAQRPSWGYAFHPPAIAWSLALFQKLLGWAFALGAPARVRICSAAFTAAIVGLGLQWMRDAGAETTGLKRGAAAFLSFAGMFALSWMMVPDLPLFLGWLLAFNASFRLSFRTPRARDLLALGAGVALATLSKYSGVLAALSAGASLLLWAPRRVRNRGLAALAIGVVLAVIPTILSNIQKDWGPLLYQLHGRHSGGHLSLSRYARFWAIQLVITGPLFFYAFGFWKRIKKGRDRVVTAYVAIWSAPAALIYFMQPLWAEFKPHWALIAWLPFALELGLEWARNPASRLARAQVAYGAPLAAFVLMACHFPIGSQIGSALTGKTPEPKLDVTNDLYGWADLPRVVRGLESAGAVPIGTPIVGSRYQTASQAAFALGDPERVTLLPRDEKQLAEWPDLGISDGQGPPWPRLKSSILYVGDNRYDGAPEFPGARCARIASHSKLRGRFLAKKLLFWRCDP